MYPQGPDYPNITRFGQKGDTIALNGVSKNVADVLKSVDDKAPMVNTKNVEDFREMSDILGQSRNLGQDSAARSIEYAYGKPSGTQIRAAQGKEPVGALEVIKGNYSKEDQLPDKDLGKSITPGFRNITLETRAFGLPSLRNDVPAPPIQNRSVANNMNYGDDATAADLINPQPFSDLRITEKSMFTDRPKEAVFAFFEKIGFGADREIMEACFAAASQDGEVCNLHDYRNQLNDYLEARDTDTLLQWRQSMGI